MGFPEPEDMTSLVLRTDFSSDDAWRAVQMAIDASDDTPCATYVSDPMYAKMDIQALVEVDAAADDKAFCLANLDFADFADDVDGTGTYRS
jgi:hypothetical protein